MWTRASILGLIMAVDLVTFALAVPSVGIDREMNPVMRGLYGLGLPAVALLKASAFALIVLLVGRLGPYRRVGLAVAIAITLVGVVGNALSWVLVA